MPRESPPRVIAGFMLTYGSLAAVVPEALRRLTVGGNPGKTTATSRPTASPLFLSRIEAAYLPVPELNRTSPISTSTLLAVDRPERLSAAPFATKVLFD